MNTTQPLEPSEALFNKLTELSAMSQNLLSVVEAGFGSLDRRVTQLEERMTAVEQRQVRAEQYLQALDQDMEIVRERVEMMDEKLDAYLREHGYLKKKLKEHDAKLNPPSVN